jgi:hypothetical protein
MAKYKALQDVPPFIKAGDIANFDQPLIPEYQKLFEAYSGEEAAVEIDDDDPLKQALINPSRDELKKRAQELEIDFAPNITTDKLLELVKTAEEKKAGEGGGEGGGE